MSIFKKRKKLWIFLALVVLVIASAAFYFSTNRKKLIEVQVDKVKRQELISKVTASGKIEPKRKVDISASIPGKIVKLAVEEGNRVQAGDFLLQIDPAPYSASVDNARAALNGAFSELESAKATLKQLEQTYRRKQRMWQEKSGLISEDEYERSKTEFEVQQSRVKAAEHHVAQARATLARAQDDLDKTRVTAPMSGVVVRRAVEEGEVAVIGTMNNPGTVLLTIADLSVMEAELEVDETDIAMLEIGQKATVSVDAFSTKKFPGEVTEIGNSPIVKGTGTNQEATDFKVTITLRTPDVVLRPGLTCDGEIITAVRPGALTVPIQSLVIRDITKGEASKNALPKEQREKEGVFLMNNNKAEFREVKTGIMGEMDMEVLQGLKEGEQLVIGSFQTLRDLKDGDGIQVKKEGKPGAIKVDNKN
ncbi:MAG TPA: efflux RND transporter periplasmic adaptor subunit [Acidobacteriota bacterium]|nr:efflux RND transporter periplasmic adaptor subunit [Acidobacteriota bacterium]